MEKTVILVAFLFSALMCNAQEIIELQEAKVGNNISTTNIINRGNHFSVNIKETSQGEFERDPVAFMNNYFDIHHLIDKIGDKRFLSYHVTFRSTKGDLNAKYDQDGNLVSTSLKLENVLVPHELKHQLYRDHKGWEMVKNLRVAKGKKGVSEMDYYKITMKNGNKKKNFKVNTSDLNRSEVAYK